MTGTAGAIANIFENINNTNKIGEGDYIKDGIYHCCKCNTPKECIITMDDRKFKMRCLCKCGEELCKERDAMLQKQKREEKIKNLRRQGIQDKEIRNMTFQNDKGYCPDGIDKAKRYTTKWDEMYQKNIGLLYWGSVGNGKTYCAASIANFLLDKGISVLMTDFTKIINQLSGFSVDDKNAFIGSLNKYHLLIIDDLGAERQSDYALEIVFGVINSRYKNGQPLILTTNLSLEEIKNPKDLRYARIYDRVNEMCVPILFKGKSIRDLKSSEKMAEARKMFE